MTPVEFEQVLADSLESLRCLRKVGWKFLSVKRAAASEE